MNENDHLVLLDLNDANFQKHLFNIGKEGQTAVIGTLRKIATMTWDQVYQDPGLKWELIRSQKSKSEKRLYSLRFGKGFRGIAYRENKWLRLLGLYPDHDSTYKT